MSTSRPLILKKLINTLLKEIGDHLDYLAQRWEDERGFEPFAEYEKSMADALPKGYTYLRGTEQPFSFRVKHNETGAIITLKCLGSSIKASAVMSVAK